MANHASNLAWKIPWMEEPGRYGPWGRKELDRTEQLHFHFQKRCVQVQCLEPVRMPLFGNRVSADGITFSDVILEWGGP